MPRGHSKWIVVKTACPTREEARQLARILMDRKLIAAGQIKTHEALYTWQAERFEETEWELSCLTRRDHFEKVQEVIIQEHSFEVPEVIALPIEAISEPFADWIDENTDA